MTYDIMHLLNVLLSYIYELFVFYLNDINMT